MNRYTFCCVFLTIFVLRASYTQEKINTDSGSNNNTGALTITVTSLDLSDKTKTLKILYEIRNDSEEDVWILVGWYQSSDTTFGMGAGVRIAKDGQTLMIRARFKTPTTVMGIRPIYGRFVRLRPGDIQTESIFIRIPVYPEPQFGHVERQEQVIKYASRLAIELGYYRGNLPERIFKTLKPPENVFPEDPAKHPISRDVFSRWNEPLISRDDEFLIVKGFRELNDESEQVLSAIVENIRIPYEANRNHTTKIKSPGLHSYEKIEIQYKPSILEYFFPYESQQSLLSPDEMGYLQSDKALVLNNKQDIHTVASYIPHTRADTTVIVGTPVRYRSHAEVVCYSGGKPFLPFTICNDNAIVIEGKYLISFKGFPSLKKLTPQIQAIDLRMRCAANLKNQWYRFRFYNMHEALRQNDPSLRNQTLYPTPTHWCDDILRPYPVFGCGIGRWNAKPHVCPSAVEGKNHYAMNPNCKPDSPADMVLLFETKPSWNQHGDPELFTFDNHEPKGGCVLLNDGTVKFIRTKEELQQLRWK